MMDRDEKAILKFWQDADIFKKSVTARKGKKRFVFFEGPPTANGQPHIGHAETRTFKDIILRYKTMRGYFVPRNAGWDTQGLPVEIEVEKALGLKTKKDVEAYGIKEFNKKCKASVWKYLQEWALFTEHLGFWIDFDKAYITYKNNYLESLWWIIKEMWNRKLLFEDNKIVPWCPRCETGLSSHELAQEYRQVKDQSLYVRFPLVSDNDDWSNTAILSWTTTPWTLPGNVALAVNQHEEYVRIPDPEKEKHWIVLGKKNFERLLEEKFFPEFYAVLDERQKRIFFGDALIGLSYQPLFRVAVLASENSYKIYHADFVSMEEGVGVVHTAVMYGEDDYRLGKQIGLPSVHTVDDSGHFVDAVRELAGAYVKSPETEKTIAGYLEKQGLLFREKMYTHDYPFCWRCKSPVLYYARKSWWVGMSALQKQLLKANSGVQWIPAHLRDGRFGEWLREVKDWAFSRSRYWGTPLPIWRCRACGGVTVVGSLEEIKEKGTSLRNRYMVLRHGEAENNVKQIFSTNPATDTFHVTKEGKKTIIETCKRLQREGIIPDVIVHSPFVRTTETADLVRGFFDVPDDLVLAEQGLGEINLGVFDGKSYKSRKRTEKTMRDHFHTPDPEGETLMDVRKRMLAALQKSEERYQGKTIFFVSHLASLWMLETGVEGLAPEESIARRESVIGAYFPKGAARELFNVRLPIDEDGFLDLHRPYIDEIKIYCDECGNVAERVPELADVWFDSGSMPYAAWHYPFENKELVDGGKTFPADFITEAVDQTRGWFYTLLAVSTALGRGAPYKHVLSLGHILDARGKKMSKSLGNIVDPMDMIAKYGADALRWYFFTVNRPEDTILFNERDILVKKRGFIDILWNSLLFCEMYKDAPAKNTTAHILDVWILEKLCSIKKTVTRHLDQYEIVEAARLIESFAGDDVSRWYIRRSRTRMKEQGTETLRVVLREISVLSAPFVPFTAEAVYQRVGGKKESVHLENWKEEKSSFVSLKDYLFGKTKNSVLAHMEQVRGVVSSALEARASAGIKVRQPLQTLKVQRAMLEGLGEEFIKIIKDEVNVKEVLLDSLLEETVLIDTKISETLKEEGHVRDLIRQIQQMRKDAKLQPRDVIRLRIGPEVEVRKYEDEIRREVRVSEIEWTDREIIEIKS